MSIPFRSKISAIDIPATMRSNHHDPVTAMIEIADRCNEVCVHCYQIQGQKGEMTTEQVKKALDELAELGVLFLTISGGEPTLRKDFLEIVAYARKLKFAVKIFSNGLRISQPMAKSLGELAVQEVQLSLYSHKPNVHDWVTGVKGSWDKTVQAVRDLRENNIKVVVKSPMMSFNTEDYPQYIEFVEGLDADYMMDTLLDTRENGETDPLSFRLDDQDIIRTLEDPKLNSVQDLDQELQKKEDKLNKRLCGACSGSVHIEANGEMRPCTQMTVPVGNVVEDGITNAWKKNTNGTKIRNLLWKDIHGCRDCDLVPFCSRCFANAQKEGGDALGPYASACERAQVSYEFVYKVKPKILSAGDRSSAKNVGPFKHVKEHTFQQIKDVITEDDQKTSEMFPWIRATISQEPMLTPPITKPGELVQIRRPGQKTPKTERIPT